MTDEDVPGIMRTGGLASRIGTIMSDDRASIGRHVGPYRLIDVLGEAAWASCTTRSRPRPSIATWR
jgi:hypothetical protein